jgi:peptidoglycan/xylan/chitin deacetylase (PgdA/CDA1 family)
VIEGTVGQVVGPVAGAEPAIRSIPLPNGAKVALTVQLTLEAWADPASARGRNMPEEAIRKGVLDWAALSAQLYGPRTGAQRLAATLEDYGARACVHLSGLVAERWPDLVAGLARNGHEIVGHGYAQDQAMAGLDEADDLAVVRQGSEVIETVTGQRPVGWSSHGSRRGNFTVLSLLKEGYTYTRDFRDADVPYVVAQLGDRRLLAMVRTDEINDLPISRSGPPSVFVEYFKRNFDQLYAEGEKGEPKVMTCVTHATVFGRPWGATALAECLKYVRGFNDVWLTTGREIADHYLEHLPPLD